MEPTASDELPGATKKEWARVIVAFAVGLGVVYWIGSQYFGPVL